MDPSDYLIPQNPVQYKAHQSHVYKGIIYLQRWSSNYSWKKQRKLQAVYRNYSINRETKIHAWNWYRSEAV
jgi:hypothetical protein